MAKPSEYCDLYKALNLSNQNKRREVLLAEQKKLRDKAYDESRNLEPVEDVEHGVKRHSKNRYLKKYKHLAMLSEWLVEVAPDFDVSWFMKACPEGYRNIVVAHNKSTKTYSKLGKLIYKFESALPGGSKTNDNSKSRITILDCIANNKNRTIYILDVLIWNNYDLRDCNAEFRFFWLKSKLHEIPELNMPNSANGTQFEYVPHTPCDFFSIKDNLATYPLYESNKPPVDGLLFYHKEASYTAGKTPLVGWLKPFMVPEKLNIPVAPNYLEMRPKKYTNLEEHIKYAKGRYKKKNQVNLNEQTNDASSMEFLEEHCEFGEDINQDTSTEDLDEYEEAIPNKNTYKDDHKLPCAEMDVSNDFKI